MTDDLVNRLREKAFRTETYELLEDAADRIEKLNEDVGVLIAASIRLSSRIDLDSDHYVDRIEKLEAALRNVTTTWDVWQKEKDSNSFTELFASICEAKALEGKDD